MNKWTFDHKAFTLAEVLITLGIIGVVAAMTIPTLVQDQQNKATITALKKAYATFSSAYASALNDYGPVDSWGVTADDGANSKLMLDILANYMKVQRNCGTTYSTCFPNISNYKYLSGGNDWSILSTNASHIRLSDGTLVAFDIYDPTTDWPANRIGAIYIDTNGYKNPNKIGVDTFGFWLTRTRVLPWGNTSDAADYNFANNCRDKSTQTGRGCTAWVIFNQNMDYTKSCGTTLSWNGPLSCN